MKPIAQLVTDARKERKMHLREFAKALGVSHMTVSQWEGGVDPAPEIFTRLMLSKTDWVRELGLDIYAQHCRANVAKSLPNLTTACPELEQAR